MKDDSFIVVRPWMVSDLKLTGNELLIYAIIFGFSMNGSSKFEGGLDYFVKNMGAAKTTVKSVLKSLEDKGHIIKGKVKKGNMEYSTYVATVTRKVGKNLTQSESDPVGICHRSGAETAPNSIYSKDDKDNEPTDKPDIKPSVALSIVCRKHGFKTTPQDPRIIALAEQSITEELMDYACRTAVDAGARNIGYAIKVLESMKAKAEAINVRGAVKKEPVQQDVWWTSDAGIDRKGRELGITPRPTETYADFKARIWEKLRENRC